MLRRGTAMFAGVVVVGLGVVAGAAPASAAHVSCGQTITANVVFDSNVGPCPVGLTIGADNITIDLNGFTLSGVPATGDGPGLIGTGRTGVTVRRGTITNFDAGVVFDGGGRNTVAESRILDNRGDFSTDFGDGIALFDSDSNTVRNNTIQNNGPYDGVGVIRGEFNTITGNQILENNQSTTSTAGIRLENVGFTPSANNTVSGNTVRNSGTFGIQLFAGARDNVVNGNLVQGARFGGIRIFAGGTRNRIENNLVRGIAGNFGGISVQAAAGNFGPATNNVLLTNNSIGNSPTNLLDGNPNCDNNQWHGNQGPPASPPCTLNP